MQLSSSLSAHRITVLLVDDQMMVAAAVQRMLASEQDITFHSCQDPSKAIQTAEEIGPTVILQDLVMPEIDGLTLVKFYRGRPKLRDVPLIVLSSKEEAVTKAEAFAVGANDYLVKLPDAVELIARIRYHSQGYINLLQRKRPTRPRQSEKALASELGKPPNMSSRSSRRRWLRRHPDRMALFRPPTGATRSDIIARQERFAVYLLDVCDHVSLGSPRGVGAQALRSQTLPTGLPRSRAGARRPQRLSDGAHNELYFTMWYGVHDRGQGTLTYASGDIPRVPLPGRRRQTVRLATRNSIVAACRVTYRVDTIRRLPPRGSMSSPTVYRCTVRRRHVEPGRTRGVLVSRARRTEWRSTVSTPSFRYERAFHPRGRFLHAPRGFR